MRSQSSIQWLTHTRCYSDIRIASAPAIFQRFMESLLQNIPGVIVYIDDILITGKNDEEHLKSLVTILKRIEDAGMLLEKEKRITPNTSWRNQEASSPKNLTQLKAYLGLLTYYGRFLHNISKHPFSLYRFTEMVRGKRVSLSKIKETPYIIEFTGSFQSLSSINFVMWHLYVRDWGSLVHRYDRWFRETNRLCFTDLSRIWKTLFTTWKRGSGLHFCSEKNFILVYLETSS